MTNLEIYEGNDSTWTVTITDSSGDAVDITGYTFLFTVKKSISDSDDDALISKNITTHISPTTGVTTITLNRADTLGKDKTTYYYDYQWIDTSDKRRTILKGLFSIVESVGDREI